MQDLGIIEAKARRRRRSNTDRAPSEEEEEEDREEMTVAEEMMPGVTIDPRLSRFPKQQTEAAAE